MALRRVKSTVFACINDSTAQRIARDSLPIAVRFCARSTRLWGSRWICAVQVFFEIGVAIAVAVGRSIRRIARVEIESSLPLVRHSITVAIDLWNCSLQHRPATDLALRVDNRAAATAHLIDDSRIHGVANRKRSSRSPQDRVKSIPGRKRSYRFRGERFRDDPELLLTIDLRWIEKLLVVRRQPIVRLEHVVANVEGELRRSADADRMGSFAARSWTNVV